MSYRGVSEDFRKYSRRFMTFLWVSRGSYAFGEASEEIQRGFRTVSRRLMAFQGVSEGIQKVLN